MLAELAIADTQFARGNYTEAVDSYKSFIRLHPTHEKVEDGYAAFRVGECYYKDMPDDVWLLPPSYEKDQSAVTDALRELDDFRKKYPDSKYMKDVEPLRTERAASRLVDHEVYVARFYLNRDHTKAAAHAARGRHPALPGLGARAGAAVRARARPTCRWAIRLRAKGHLPARGQRLSAPRPQARRSELYLEFIHQRFGDNPQARAGRRAGQRDPAASVPGHG